MSKVYEWNKNVNVCVELDLYPNPNGLFLFGDMSSYRFSEKVSNILLAAVSDRLGDPSVEIELIVTLNSKGYYDPGSTYGPPEKCYPPESDEERTFVDVEFRWAGDKISLDEESKKTIWDEVEDDLEKWS